jgi:hypothetical protein
LLERYRAAWIYTWSGENRDPIQPHALSPHTPDIASDPDWEEFAPDSPLEEAVTSELVSAQFPVMQGKYREFH